MSEPNEALAVLMHYHLQGIGSTFGLRVRERGDEYIAKRHAEDHAVVPCPVCQALAKIGTKNGEEIEAKKTVPMAMLCSIAIACVHYELNRDYPWSQDDLRTIAARYGYEVTE